MRSVRTRPPEGTVFEGYFFESSDLLVLSRLIEMSRGRDGLVLNRYIPEFGTDLQPIGAPPTPLRTFAATLAEHLLSGRGWASLQVSSSFPPRRFIQFPFLNSCHYEYPLFSWSAAFPVSSIDDDGMHHHYEWQLFSWSAAFPVSSLDDDGLHHRPELRFVKQFRGGLVFKAHRRLYHSTIGL